MKKDKSSILILFVEIAAIILLHSAKSRQTVPANKLLVNKQPVVSTAHPFQVLSVSKLK